MCFQTLCLFIRASCVVDMYLEVILWTSLPIMPGLYNKYTHTPRREQTPTAPTPETSCQAQVGTKHRNCSFLKTVFSGFTISFNKDFEYVQRDFRNTWMKIKQTQSRKTKRKNTKALLKASVQLVAFQFLYVLHAWVWIHKRVFLHLHWPQHLRLSASVIVSAGLLVRLLDRWNMYRTARDELLSH